MAKKRKEAWNDRQMEFLLGNPSTIIRMALEDLEACERSKKFKIDMSCFIDPFRRDDKCSVCYAGSVIARSFDYNLKEEYKGHAEELEKQGFPRVVAARLEHLSDALDNFRTGNVGTGLIELGITKGSLPEKTWWQMTSYESDPAMFKKDLKTIAKYLEDRGL